MSNRPANQIVTRFAPSPTGYLHIGGARTALFNWAFARRHNGVFILRIEDTDKARSTDAATQGIIEDMRWLGIDWDEGPEKGGEFGPYFQSERDHLYKDFLDRMVKVGRAYRCFKSQDQLKAEREAQKAAGAPMKYDPTESLSRSEADQQSLIAGGKPFVWRFRMPVGEAITVADLVLGDVTIKPEELEDFVIVKGDGGPTFHFANVVDDATMGVTHVLRAQEHLMNTPKHVAMFDALGIARPKYAHMPLIFNSDSTKMSKRDKAKTARNSALAWEKRTGKKFADLYAEANDPRATPELIQNFLDKKGDDTYIAALIAGTKETFVLLPEIDVHDFRTAGYLPGVILNYIALLGWSPGGNVERFDLDWLKQNFAIEAIGKANARFDRKKLLAFNGATLQALSPAHFRMHFVDYLHLLAAETNTRANAYLDKLHSDPEAFAMFVEAYRPRTQVLLDPIRAGEFFVASAFPFVDKAVEMVLKSNDREGLKTLEALHVVLKRLTPWNPSTIHLALEKFSTDTGRSMGDVAQPLRVALTGNTVSPAIHDTLAFLRQDPSLTRIKHCIETFGVN